jgi:hypothetical protein
LLWAAFIPACEALDPKLQGWLIKWFDRSFKASGLQDFNVALKVAKQVWEKTRPALKYFI